MIGVGLDGDDNVGGLDVDDADLEDELMDLLGESSGAVRNAGMKRVSGTGENCENQIP
jgi:hypothetical protein